jgi:hypothetical protein
VRVEELEVHCTTASFAADALPPWPPWPPLAAARSSTVGFSAPSAGPQLKMPRRNALFMKRHCSSEFM